MPTSHFDSSAFLETTFKGQLDTSYVLPDEDDYNAQISDRIEYTAGTISETKQRAGEPWANLTVWWELLDDKQRQRLNMAEGQKLLVRQGIMLDLLPGSTPEQPMLDFGTNKNMRLKRLLEATGLNKQKNWTLNSLKYQHGTVKVKHRRPEGFDDDIAEVVSVSAPNGHG
jgi:hypothetical protein